ncbi:stage III sporulation protein AG [Virgibacillus oceani]|uniref:Stage III sporulation protein AG n=1 Tax=Virgibacillus oceani TaxID=1479511 RepID=A0A917LXC6_9BACI|nr:stage III sporulation protein AG [Virgibacillus oceani]GGG63931.1 stage III sporulation protein AG [Virgibacillus oceani]
MKQKLKEFFKEKKVDSKIRHPSKKTGYLIVIGLIGLLLLILSNVFSTSQNEGQQEVAPVKQATEGKTAGAFSEKKSTTSNVSELEGSYEKDLQEMLEKIQGVSEVEVMVNLDSTKVKVYEKNLITGQQVTDEEDKTGGTRKIEDSTKETQVVLVRQGDKEVPLLIQTKKPEVRGVFVVAKGVDHATVKKWVIEAVSRVLDVPTHRVSVMPKN